MHMTPRGPPPVRYSRRRRVPLIMPGFLNCACIVRYYFAKSMFSEVIKRCKKTRQAPKIQAPRVFRAFIMPAYCVIYRYNSIDPALVSCFFDLLAMLTSPAGFPGPARNPGLFRADLGYIYN